MKTMIRLTTALLIAVLCLAGMGCGGEELPEGTILLTVGTRNDAYEQKTINRWKEAYESEHKDVRIQVTPGMTTMDTLASWANGTMPDLVWAAGDQHGYWSGATKYFVDLNEFLTGEDANYFDDFYPSILATTHFSNDDEGIWFMPRDYNALVVYINTEIFKDAGIPIPSADWTFEDFEEICGKLKTHFGGQLGKFPCELDYTWGPFTTTMMNNFGASFYDGEGNFTGESAETQACFEYISSFVGRGYFSGKGTNVFAGRRAGMMIRVRPELPRQVDGGFAMTALPFPGFSQAANGKGYVGVGCSGYAITTACPEEERAAAWDFLKFITSEAGYEAVGSIGTIVPVRKSLAATGKWTEYADKMGNVFDPSVFLESEAEPIDLNYVNCLKPQDQKDMFQWGIEFFQKATSANHYDDAMTLLKNHLRGKQIIS